jgi:hypothetical protein
MEILEQAERRILPRRAAACRNPVHQSDRRVPRFTTAQKRWASPLGFRLAQLCEFANLLCSAQIESFCSCSLRDHSAVNLPNE